jgi:hypothetical protein
MARDLHAFLSFLLKTKVRFGENEAADVKFKITPSTPSD